MDARERNKQAWVTRVRPQGPSPSKYDKFSGKPPTAKLNHTKKIHFWAFLFLLTRNNFRREHQHPSISFCLSSVLFLNRTNLMANLEILHGWFGVSYLVCVCMYTYIMKRKLHPWPWEWSWNGCYMNDLYVHHSSKIIHGKRVINKKYCYTSCRTPTISVYCYYYNI